MVDDEIERARERAAAQGWPVARVLAELEHVDTIDSQARAKWAKEREVLVPGLLRAVKEREGRAKLKGAVLLLHLGESVGTDAIVELLRDGGEDMRVETLVELTILPCAPRGASLWPTLDKPVAMDADRLWDGLAPLLVDPTSRVGKLALDVATRFPSELARDVLAGFLGHPSAAVRLEVAKWRAARGEDEGALAAVEEVLLAEPGDFHLRYDALAVLDDYAEADRPPGSAARARRAAAQLIEMLLGAFDPEGANLVHQALAVIREGDEEVELLRRVAASKHAIWLREAAEERLGELGEVEGLVAVLVSRELREGGARAAAKAPVTTELGNALEAALEAELGDPRPSVVGALVRALVAQGRADARGVERAVPLLDPWDRALVHWLHGGITPQAVAEKLVGAGVIAMPSAAWLEEAAAEWQTDPSPFGVIAHLLEDHLTGFDTESSLELDYRWLVEELARCTAGALELEGVSQRVENGRVEIELIHEGQVTGFSAQIRGDWYDVPAVLDALNGVVAARGARFFPLQTGDQLVMVVYAPTAFAEVAALLHIPLEGDANEAASRGAAYEREVIAKE